MGEEEKQRKRKAETKKMENRQNNL